MTGTAVGAADDDQDPKAGPWDGYETLGDLGAAVHRLASQYQNLARAYPPLRERFLSAEETVEFEQAIERLGKRLDLTPAQLKAVGEHPLLTVVGPGDPNWETQVQIARDVLRHCSVDEIADLLVRIARDSES